MRLLNGHMVTFFVPSVSMSLASITLATCNQGEEKCPKARSGHPDETL